MQAVRGGLFRAGQWLVYWLLWAGMVWAALAQGVTTTTVTTTTVQGTVYLANGTPAAGMLQISWPSFTTAAGQAIAAGRTMVAIGAGGLVSVDLAANQGAYPGGLFYTVIYNLSDGSVHTEYWTVPAAAQATIGAVRAQILPAAQAIQAVNKTYVDQAIATAQASDLTANGGTLTGPLYLSGDPTTPLQAADKHYVDGQFALALPLAGGAATGPLTAVQLGAVYQVDQFPGADIGAKLQACVNNLNSTFGGVCDARNFPGTLTIAANVTIATPNAVIDLPCATITTSAQFIVTAGTRNVVVHGCGFQGGSTASGTQGGTVWVYTGSSNAFQIGDRTGAANTPGFFMHDININTATAGAGAAGIYFERAQEVRLDGIYLNGNNATGQIGVVLDGTGNYAGGTFIDVYINGFGTGWQLTGDALGNFANASTFVKTHVVCPTSVSGGTPIVGTIGVNVLEGDGNTWSGGDVESCSTMFHLGPNAVNNTIDGLRNENSTIQYQADSGSKWNAVFTGGTFFTGELIDNGSRNSFWDAFHRNANGMKGDWYASQQDATVTNHIRVGIGSGNERGISNEIQTDYGYRWEEGYSDAMGTGFQTWALQDLLNNVNRLAVGQYLSATANVVTNIVLNNGGCYNTSTPPTITISGGAGTGATATATMAASTSLSCNGGAGFQVASVAVTAIGSGYTSAPTVTFAGANQVTAPNSIAEIVSAGSTNNQTVINSAGTGSIVLNGSNNAGTGGIVIGSGGLTSTAVATIGNTGNAQFIGSLSVNGTSLSAGTLSVRNGADTEVDYYLQPGLTATQKGSFTYKDYTGTSQWYMVKDASNNWSLNSAPGNIDILKAFQNTNSGDTYLDTSNATGHIRLNFETGTGTETDIYSGGSTNLDAAFQSPTAIKFPGLAATSGKFCLQIDNSGFLSNTGTACGTGTGTGSGTSGIINSGTSGQIAVYSSTGTTIAGVTNLSIAAGGTGATTAAAALTSLGAQAALPGVSSNGSNGVTVTGSIAASAVSSSTSVSSANNVINIMAPPYNAQCNLLEYSALTASAGATTITVAGATSKLVGQTLILWGAGAAAGNTNLPVAALVSGVSGNAVSLTNLTTQPVNTTALGSGLTTAIPNASNPNGQFEIGNDDTLAIQAAYNAAHTSGAAILFPAPGTTAGGAQFSCFAQAIDLSAGVAGSYNPVPVKGDGSIVSFVTGFPGQDVFQGPDGKVIGSGYTYLKGLEIRVDDNVDVSCPTQRNCPSVGNGQTTFGRFTGVQVAETINDTYPAESSIQCTSGTAPYTCTVALSNQMGGQIQCNAPVHFTTFTGTLAALSNTTQTAMCPAAMPVSVAIASQNVGSGYSGSWTCTVNGGTFSSQATCSASVTGANGLLFTIMNPGVYTVAPTSISFTGGTFTPGTPASVSISTTTATNTFIFQSSISSLNGFSNATPDTTGQISGTMQITNTAGLPASSAPLITPGPSVFQGASIAQSADGTFDLLTVANPNSNGGNFQFAPIDGPIGKVISIPGISLSATITGNVTSTTFCPSGDSCVTFFPAYSGAASKLTGSWGFSSPSGPTGDLPPWYLGNAGVAYIASNATTAGGPQGMYDDLNFQTIGPAPPRTVPSGAFMIQQGTYFGQFERIAADNLYYGYAEVLPVINGNISNYTPDTASYKNLSFNVALPWVSYAGNHRSIDGWSVYNANNPLTLGPMVLNGPENAAGGWTVSHFYHECWGLNNGTNQVWMGGGFTISYAALTQCAGNTMGPQVVWAASASNVIGGIGGPASPSPATAGLQLLGSGNIFSVGLANNSDNPGAQVNDLGIGNRVLGNLNNVRLPVWSNSARCTPGEFDASSLGEFASSPFTSMCGLILDYSTALLTGPGAGNAQYMSNSTAFAAPYSLSGSNLASGFIYSPSGIGGFDLNAIGEPFTVCNGCRVPLGTINLVTEMATGTTGTVAVNVFDMTASTNIFTCTVTISAANTVALHGYAGSSDPCSFSTSALNGHTLEVGVSGAPMGGALWFGFSAFVPVSTVPKTLPNGSTATTQTTSDASNQVATDAFVHSAIASQTGYQLTEWTNGGQKTSPGVSFSANATELYSFELSGSLSASKISYTPSAADVSSSDFYDIGIYNATGGLVCQLGATPGSKFAPNTNTVTLSFTSACSLLGGARYYLGITASSAIATLTSVGSMMMADSGFTPSSGSATTGGALNSSMTPPADGWNANATMPQIALHN